LLFTSKKAGFFENEFSADPNRWFSESQAEFFPRRENSLKFNNPQFRVRPMSRPRHFLVRFCEPGETAMRRRNRQKSYARKAGVRL
jgi:hypothetical protein